MNLTSPVSGTQRSVSMVGEHASGEAVNFHTRALYIRGLEVHGCPLGNALERTQFILWSLILAFLILRLIWRLDLLGSFCAGLAFGAGWLSLLIPNCDPNYW